MKWDENQPFELFSAILNFQSHFLAAVFWIQVLTALPVVEPATHVTLHRLNMEEGFFFSPQKVFYFEN